MNKILEVSNRKSKGGRRRIEIVLHKIPSDEREVNLNGIHWSETNTLKNIETVKGIPICAEFASDDKEVPIGHGYTSTGMIDDKPSPFFENSEVCGYIDHGEIRDIEVNGSQIKALVGIGYLYEQRYPKFVQWVRDNVETSTVDTSVEIMGREENDNKIVYESGECSEDYRVPKDYVYSGTAIISVTPADSDAIVLECAEAKVKNKEDYSMTEQEIMEIVKNAIADTSAIKEACEAKVTELNSALEEKEAKITELNATIEQIQKALSDLQKEQEGVWQEREALEKELGQLRAEKRLGELNDVLANYSEEELKYAESEINSFKEDPMNGSIDAIKSKICVAIVDKRNEDAKVSEQNSRREDETEDIFGEVNSVSEEEDTNIF